MATTIDARGRSCPEPVLLTRNALTSGEAAYEVLVDNQTAVQNVTRFAEKSGYAVELIEREGTYHMALQRK